MSPFARTCFLLGASGSLCASLVHIWAIFSGPDAYAALGAPPDIVASAKAGTWYAPSITLLIAAVIFGWALYALSAARLLPRLILLRTGLIAIASVLLLRAVAWIPLYLLNGLAFTAFDIWSSLICFALGAVYALGTLLDWSSLKPVGAS